ncbi:MAG: septum formation initiator family protein [Pyrinomonadaceae bacterium MAG19_C2-C3]|nr:septum formation initiator family protein [Pyrinomonadaceae bacterium MAG19_C2-C3]
MSKVANTYWIDSRLATQRVATQTRTMALPSISNTREEVVTLPRTRDAAQTSIVRPSYILTSFIVVALFVLCFTLTGRTRLKLEAAAGQQAQMSGQVEALRSANLMLKQQVIDLRTNPRAIEAAARTQLGMVRANEIVVPVR